MEEYTPRVPLPGGGRPGFVIGIFPRGPAPLGGVGRSAAAPPPPGELLDLEPSSALGLGLPWLVVDGEGTVGEVRM